MICDGFDLFLLVHPLGMVGDNLGMVGDNLDKNVSRRYQRIDRQTQSYHFFQTYAVGDRIDLSFTLEAPNCFLYPVYTTTAVLSCGTDLRKNRPLIVG